MSGVKIYSCRKPNAQEKNEKKALFTWFIFRHVKTACKSDLKEKSKDVRIIIAPLRFWKFLEMTTVQINKQKAHLKLTWDSL